MQRESRDQGAVRDEKRDKNRCINKRQKEGTDACSFEMSN